MYKRILLTAFLTVSLGACSFKKPSSQTPEEKAAAEVLQTIEQQKFDGQLTKDNVKIEFLEAEEPGLYQLFVSWPRGIPAVKVNFLGEGYSIINGNNSFSRFIRHSETVTLHLVALNSIGGEISTFEKKLSTPKDLIVDSRLTLDADKAYKVQRVYFLNQAQIVTKGHQLQIEADKLYIEKDLYESSGRDFTLAHVLTFLPGETAIQNGDITKQLRGSNVIINVRKAEGTLRVAMIGVDGFDGRPGSDAIADRSLNGVAGKSGRIKSMPQACDSPPCRKEIICEEAPTNGTHGKKGHPGGPGEDGTHGGNTGMLSLMVEDQSDFQMRVYLRAGKPGKGGSGGAGSPGGLGGAAGENPLNHCGFAQDGAPGAPGDAGPNGKPGAAGLVFQPISNVKNILIHEQ